MAKVKNKVLLLLLFAKAFVVLSSVASLEERNQLLFFFDKVEVNGEVDVFLKKGDKRGESLNLR